MGFEVIDVQPTPNPNAMKYVVDKPISDSPRSYFNAAAAAGDELAMRLFAIDGVTSLLLLNDFVTVNKRADVKWSAMTAAVKKVLAS